MALSVDPFRCVERHPQYSRIIQAMAERVPDSQIAKAQWLKPPIDRTTLWRFRKTKLEAKLQQAALGPATVAATLQAKGLLANTDQVNEAVNAVVAATVARLGADPYLARIARHQQTIDDSLQDARADKDGRTVAALIGTDLKGLELDARLTGRLETVATTTNIYVVQNAIALPPAPERPVIDVKAEE